MIDFSRFSDFKDDQFLGMAIDAKDSHMIITGLNGIKSLELLEFMGGGKKLSNLCGFKFASSIPEAIKANKTPYLFVVFVAKLRSKIFRRSPQNPSQWYAMMPIGNGSFKVLSHEDCLAKYAFDLDKFFKSSFFADKSKKMQQKVTQLTETSIPDFIATLTNQNEITEANKFLQAIKESIPHITSTRYMNKTFDLIQFDRKTYENDNEAIPNESELNKAIDEELKRRGI